jgi:hypothetical protein
MLIQISRGETAYRHLEEPESAEHNALARVLRLPNGSCLLVDRDLDKHERMFRMVTLAGRWSVAIVIVRATACSG